MVQWHLSLNELSIGARYIQERLNFGIFDAHTGNIVFLLAYICQDLTNFEVFVYDLYYSRKWL